MPTEKIITLYKYDELSDEAKEKARDWYRCGGLDYDWCDSVYEMADTAASLLGIDIDRKGKSTPAIYFSGFSSQGDGACFEGTWRYKKGWKAAGMAEFGEGEWRDAIVKVGEALQRAAASQFYKISAVCRHRGHYQHSGCISVEVTHVDILPGMNAGDSD